MRVSRMRIWSEFLPPEELGSSAVISLLQRFGVEPIVALPPQAETTAMADALRRLSCSGLRLGIWPLLSDEQGYWPSEQNAIVARDRVLKSVRFAQTAGANVDVVAMDLEPPLGMTSSLIHGTPRQRATILWRAFAGRNAPERAEIRATAAAELSSVATELAARNIETIAAVVPPIMLDLAAGKDVWQSMFRTPVASADWSVISPMMYTSMIGMVMGRPMAVRMLAEAARLGARFLGQRASVSIGLVSAGKLEDEKAYRCPDELAQDAAIARAAGIDDLALFCLEGVLHRGNPESWLQAAFADGSEPRRNWAASIIGRIVTSGALAATRVIR